LSPYNNFKFSEEYIVQRLSSNNLDTTARFCICTIQRMFSMPQVLNWTEHRTAFASKLEPATKFHLFETLKKCMTRGGPRKYANLDQ
jgi:hypothetical protein